MRGCEAEVTTTSARAETQTDPPIAAMSQFDIPCYLRTVSQTCQPRGVRMASQRSAVGGTGLQPAVLPGQLGQALRRRVDS